jgi:hypothetical protein
MKLKQFYQIPQKNICYIKLLHYVKYGSDFSLSFYLNKCDVYLMKYLRFTATVIL